MWGSWTAGVHGWCKQRSTLQRLALVAISATVPWLCGCQGLEGSGSVAQIRFVHTAPSLPDVDFSLNHAGAAFGVGFSTFTSYLRVSPGEYTVAAERTRGGQALATVRTSLSSGRQYTVVMRESAGGIQERVYEDQNVPAEPGQLALRVIDEADGAGPLDVYLLPAGSSGVVPAGGALTPGTASGYLRLPARGSYGVGILRANGLPVSSYRTVLTGVTVRGGPGAVRTLVITDNGLAGGNGLYGFVLDDVDPV